MSSTIKLLPKIIVALVCVLTLWAECLIAQSSSITHTFTRTDDEPITEKQKLLRIFESRNFIAGLTSGISEFNKTVDSLMEEVFYSLIDKELSTQLTDDSSLASSYSRDVFPTGLGTYVVLDKFQLGPDYLREIGNVASLPLDFSGSSKVFITNARHRSDANRMSENKESSLFTFLHKNWFGILQLLGSVLPPSFNQEELYDPLQYLETPFLFPSTVTQALSLPLGSVRSYGILTDISASAQLNPQFKIESNAKNKLPVRAPLSENLEREHRISILRHGKSEVWLALSESHRLGTDLSVQVGKKLMSLEKVVSWWKGIAVPLFPVDFTYGRGRTIRTDELFSFDLSKKSARVAFERALHGNFESARSLASSTELQKSNGIFFQFKRTKQLNGKQTKSDNSLYIKQASQISSIEKGEIKTDTLDTSHLLLEVQATHDSRDWNILVGSKYEKYISKSLIPVVKKKKNKKLEYYDFDDTIDGKSLRYMTTSYKIVDSYVNTSELNFYLEQIKKFSGLTLDGIPYFPSIPQDMKNNYFRKFALANPSDRIIQRKLASPTLGKIEAFAEAYFSWETLNNIASKSKGEIWRAIAHTFQFNESTWTKAALDENFLYYTNILGSYAFYPFRALRLNFPDFSVEGHRIVSALEAIVRAKTPEDLLQSYANLLDTDNQAELTQILRNLAGENSVPILVGFRTEAQNQVSDTSELKQLKENYDKLNGKIFQSRWPIPDLSVNNSVDEKMRQFETGVSQTRKDTPFLSQMKISLDAPFNQDSTDCRVELFMSVANLNPIGINGPMQAYIRFESNQALKVGSFLLGEDVVSLDQFTASDSLNSTAFTHFIDLKKYPHLNEIFSSDTESLRVLDLYISLSQGGDLWGAEQHLTFRINKGILQN